MDQLKTYLVKQEKRIQRLPKDWLNVEKALVAMEERTTLMQTALDKDNVHSLMDLVLLSVPGYKFSIALQTIKRCVDLEARIKNFK